MTKSEMPLSFARSLAVNVIERLKPFCKRIEIAGSIRRQKPIIGDIEIVLIPKTDQQGLFESDSVRDSGFIKTVKGLGARIKGNAEQGKYIQILLDWEQIKVDLFIANENNFGLIHMLRTGSWQFSKRMVTICKKAGYYVKNGYLWDIITGEMIPIPEESEFFRLLGIYEPPPEKREI